MPRKLAAYLWDLASTIDLITEFTTGMTFAEFEKDDLVASGVERKITILGEALRQMVEHYPGEADFAGSFLSLVGFQD